MSKRKDPMAFINRLAAELGLVSRQPNMRYFTATKGDPYRYCWTTERTKDRKFYALIYRELKNGTWVLKKKRAFGRRKTAKKYAGQWAKNRAALLEARKGRRLA